MFQPDDSKRLRVLAPIADAVGVSAIKDINPEIVGTGVVRRIRGNVIPDIIRLERLSIDGVDLRRSFNRNAKQGISGRRARNYKRGGSGGLGNRRSEVQHFGR